MPFSIALAYESARHFDEAITWFEKAFALAPSVTVVIGILFLSDETGTPYHHAF